MSDFASHLLTAFALVFVIEGLLYAVFPKHIQNIMRLAAHLPQEKFRYYGAAMAAFGVMLVWLLQKII
jgi:uncharacterized protein YjeT (DUF2065 family)